MLHYGAPQPHGTPQPRRESAIQWARGLLGSPSKWVILDTETTGLSLQDQVIQIGVLGGDGKVLINNQLLRPTCDMSPEAQGVHGISLEQLKDAPTYLEYAETLHNVLNNKIVVIYNAAFDTRVLAQTAKALIPGNDPMNYRYGAEVACAMTWYARYVGERNRSNGRFKHQKLPSGAHNALADCFAVYNLIEEMAKESS